MRLDVYLLQMKLASSRSHAQALIEAGQVYQLKQDQKIYFKKSNAQVQENQLDIGVDLGPANRFVSRGGLKLDGALSAVQLSVQGFQVLDVGISTGGFTDCLLQRGASAVIGVDVGHGQLHATLAVDKRLQHIEGLNAREIDTEPRLLKLAPSLGFDLIVMDVSFISITLVIPQLLPLLKKSGYLLSLVKPQFEVGTDGIGKGGLVKDPGLYSGVEDRVRNICSDSGLSVQNYFESSIEGKDGNKEFFVFAQK